jgi:sulfoxide reductase heme-binding subunit YedZ
MSANVPVAPKFAALPIGGVKAVVFVLALLPAGMLIWQASTDIFDANPLETLIRGLGRWAFNFLLLTLTITPFRRLSGWHWLIRLRRMLGLFSFFYVCLHLVCYLWVDQSLDWQAIGKDILKRPFITMGMLAFVLLLPLAMTSSNRAVRHLGGRRWQALHRIVYLIAIAAVLHFWWLVKIDTRVPLYYALMLAILLGLRLWWWLQPWLAARQRSATCGTGCGSGGSSRCGSKGCGH